MNYLYCERRFHEMFSVYWPLQDNIFTTPIEITKVYFVLGMFRIGSRDWSVLKNNLKFEANGIVVAIPRQLEVASHYKKTILHNIKYMITKLD